MTCSSGPKRASRCPVSCEASSRRSPAGEGDLVYVRTLGHQEELGGILEMLGFSVLIRQSLTGEVHDHLGSGGGTGICSRSGSAESRRRACAVVIGTYDSTDPVVAPDHPAIVAES